MTCWSWRGAGVEVQGTSSLTVVTERATIVCAASIGHDGSTFWSRLAYARSWARLTARTIGEASIWGCHNGSLFVLALHRREVKETQKEPHVWMLRISCFAMFTPTIVGLKF